jgi:heat shock protein HtpX
MAKRVLLFLATNILVMVTISLIINLLGLNHYLSRQGINYQQLLIFCLIWGMAGSFISLLLSKTMAKMAMGVQVIDPQSASGIEKQLLAIVYQLAAKAGLRQMPEVGIYQSPEVNAFATGPGRNHALVAVSAGLLNNMNGDEVEAVLGHEISHIANGDMVTMTLLQGIINSFALFLSRIVAYTISLALARGEEEQNANGISMLTYSVLSIVFDIIFTLLGSILVAAFSRWREYRADHGGATLAGRQKMINALARLQGTEQLEDDRAPSIATLKIANQHRWLALFATHPPLEARIARLKQMSI